MRLGKISADAATSSGVRLLYHPISHLLLIAALGLLAYANTFQVPFLFDDQSSITANPVISSLDNFLDNSSGHDSRPRRFIGYLSFALNYRLGGLEPAGYHAVNLALHILNALLVYILVRLSFSTPFLALARSGGEPEGGSPAEQGEAGGFRLLIALCAALIFVAHPIQTQAVTYIVQRLTSLATFFYLLALVLYVRMRLEQEAAQGALFRTVTCYLLALGSVLMAMKTKEIAFTLPLILLLYECSFFGLRGRVGQRIIMLLPFLGTLCIIPLSMVNTRKPVGELLSDVSVATSVQTDLSRWDYLLTQLSAIATYLRLLVLPVAQNLDYDYPVYHSLFAPRVLMSLLLHLALAGLALYLYCRSGRPARHPGPQGGFSAQRYARLIGFGICWFYLTLSVESSVIPIVDVIFEHRVYLPSVGAFLAAATAAALAVRMLPAAAARKGALCLLAAGIMALAAATYQRNEVWGDGVTLWQDVVKKSPGKARGYNNLGEVYSAAGRSDDAIAAFVQAIKLDPGFLEAYNNLGAALSDAGRPEQAIEALTRAIQIKPDHAEAYYNLGRTYLMHTERSAEAVRLLTQAIALRDDYSDAYVNLAAAHNKMGNFAASVQLLESKRQLLGGRSDAHLNRGVAYHCLGNRAAAARELAALQALDPGAAANLESFMQRPFAAGSKPGTR